MKHLIPMRILSLKLIVLCMPLFIAARCSNNDSNPPIPQENTNEYGLDATFDVGENYSFKQFITMESSMGLQTASCNFQGNQMTVGFGALNYLDPTKSNGFSCGFSIDNVTHTGVYTFRKEDAAAKNTSTLIKRVRSGLVASSPSPLKIYDNTKNKWRLAPDEYGVCREQDLEVGFQSIDITRYSSENGGIIEGSFYLNVYHKPVDKCAQYEHQLITGNFKLKRINIPE
ncbi:hypothetical protein [Dyadobacter psychrotolerans]|uniref:Lipoprotein n=1 Tax=Dyadobacter psychrotolerans TaxID=2541721 RepID=A0A4R5DR08_9BACT|nr:hypothetical protein [Dyadobacter psychrotolerans]TDE14640.1 hypothetical protein E0F88_15730 [Dyadobacter psychrotolerans]